MSDLLFREKAWDDFLYWQNHDPKMVKRINMLLLDVGRSSFDGVGKPEPLKGELSGFWSRRIDSTHRLVYRVKGETIEILSCKGHYE